jgi:hypothetical protein
MISEKLKKEIEEESIKFAQAAGWYSIAQSETVTIQVAFRAGATHYAEEVIDLRAKVRLLEYAMKGIVEPSEQKPNEGPIDEYYFIKGPE